MSQKEVMRTATNEMIPLAWGANLIPLKDAEIQI